MMKHHWSWPGLAAVILATAIGIGWTAGFIISAWQPTPISEAGINMLNGLGAAIVAAVTAYIGFRSGRGNNDDGDG